MTLRLRFAVRSDVGLLRDENEDAAYAGLRLLAVADGMGGHAAGEVASRVAIENVAHLDDDSPDTDLLAALRAALDAAQHGIRERAASDDALAGMGTTLTALLWAGTRLGVAHIGDSRGYLLRDGRLQQITHDHTYVQDLVDAGRITPEEAGSHPQRALITRALDGRGEIEPDLAVREVRAGDRYLLCTDGLSGVVSAATMRSALGSGDPAEAADRLVELALRSGGPDNVTVVVADVVEGDDLPASPVVAGAASDVVLPTRSGAETAAGRAALATRKRRRRRPAPGGDPAPRRRVRRWALGGLVVLVVLALAAGAFWWWLRSQFYVGVDAGHIAIFRGVEGAVGGVPLHSVVERRGTPLAALPPYERDRVQDGIPAASLAGARRIAGGLDAALPCPSPPLVPTPTPAGRATPSAGGPTPLASIPAPAPSRVPVPTQRGPVGGTLDGTAGCAASPP